MTVFQLEQIRLAVQDRAEEVASKPARDIGKMTLHGTDWNSIWELRVEIDRAMDFHLFRDQAIDDIRSRR